MRATLAAPLWAGLQLDYDMAQVAKRADTIKVRRVTMPTRAA
jgi:hypothetical protein